MSDPDVTTFREQFGPPAPQIEGQLRLGTPSEGDSMSDHQHDPLTPEETRAVLEAALRSGPKTERELDCIVEWAGDLRVGAALLELVLTNDTVCLSVLEDGDVGVSRLSEANEAGMHD